MIYITRAYPHIDEKAIKEEFIPGFRGREGNNCQQGLLPTRVSGFRFGYCGARRSLSEPVRKRLKSLAGERMNRKMVGW